VFEPALPGLSAPDNASPVASAKQNIGWKPNPPLFSALGKSGPASCASQPSDRVVGGGGGAAGNLGEGGRVEVGVGGTSSHLLNLVHLLTSSGEADLEAVYLTEPALLSGFDDSGDQIVADLD
jgi:hypothetical protein